MLEYQYWTHRRSGDTYAVEIINGQVVGACGLLYYKHYQDYPEKMSEIEYNREDGEWVQNNKDDFRLEES